VRRSAKAKSREVAVIAVIAVKRTEKKNRKEKIE
jgi:hypothetical protein